MSQIPQNPQDDPPESAGNEVIEVKPETKGLKALAPPLLISIAVVYGAMSFLMPSSFVTKKDFTTNIQSVAEEVTALKNEVGNLKSNVVTKDIITPINAELTAIKNQISSFVARDTITSLQSDVNNLKNTATNNTDLIAKVNTLQNTITSLTDKLKTAEDKIATQQTQIASLQSGITSPGVPTGQVTATVIGNTFTGSQVLTFAPIVASSTGSQSFTFTLNNGTGKTINNVQLAVGLQLMDSNGNVMVGGLPTGTTVSLTSPSLTAIWQTQSTGFAYLIGFTNTSPTGIFGGLGAITQPAGNASYQITVTVATGTTPLASQFSIYPIIKIVSFN